MSRFLLSLLTSTAVARSAYRSEELSDDGPQLNQNHQTDPFHPADHNKDGHIGGIFEVSHHYAHKLADQYLNPYLGYPNKKGATAWATNGFKCVWPFVYGTVTYTNGRCMTEALAKGDDGAGLTKNAGVCATGVVEETDDMHFWGFCPGTYTKTGEKCMFPFFGVDENHQSKLFYTCAPKAGLKGKTWCPTAAGWGDCDDENTSVSR